MTDYANLKVPELKKLLADKKLPQTGNKADLIARLQENDGKHATTAETAPASVKEPAKGDDKKSDGEASKLKATESQPVAEDQQPKAKTEEKLAPAPAKANATEKDIQADEAAKPVLEEAPQSFALGLSTTAADAEAKKRVDRAKRFGMEEDEEFKKRAERAKRFGVDENTIASSIDSALPERAAKRSRGRDADDDNPRNGKRQQVDRRGERRSTRQTRNGGATRDTRAARKGGSVLDDPEEKAKAEKRAARFAAA
ncbi:DNA-binding SAP [Ophiocordyceps camponoti-floridani]|uniref:DNA-binding SAP n=1 Tax=Ophiocordyceps camponoti-floridani TaxID=2030778 RepID=A0A8H4QA02_9HYPO|nr:DNA-binding SAP [Ophiocordyceps camponoti-floridani]